MAWDRNDYIAAALILIIVVVGFLVAVMLMGWMPSVDDFFKFTDPKEAALSYPQTF